MAPASTTLSSHSYKVCLYSAHRVSTIPPVKRLSYHREMTKCMVEMDGQFASFHVAGATGRRLDACASPKHYILRLLIHFWELWLVEDGDYG